MSVLMVSMFFCFISVMLELAVSRVKRARACTYASLSSYNTHTHTHTIIYNIKYTHAYHKIHTYNIIRTITHTHHKMNTVTHTIFIDNKIHTITHTHTQ